MICLDFIHIESRSLVSLFLSILLLPLKIILTLTSSILFLTSPLLTPLILLLLILLLVPYALWLVLFLVENIASLSRHLARLLTLPFKLLWEPFGWLINMITESARAQQERNVHWRRRGRAPGPQGGRAKRVSVWEGRNEDDEADDDDGCNDEYVDYYQREYTYGEWGSQVGDPLRGPGARERYMTGRRARYFV
ncbi:hypothetical protein QC761_507080 [Podospora bellae-mahoneyi]|uniref:Uncharacterized protein n=1 Tax=Podospora bellae-mahoneyi TaxID=2093777 RepID=A0ABR0FEL4_9PEZI|nr:hypothetical protein QC761_507080 [Podospora bellae-mahoneyi]